MLLQEIGHWSLHGSIIGFIKPCDWRRRAIFCLFKIGRKSPLEAFHAGNHRPEPTNGGRDNFQNGRQRPGMRDPSPPVCTWQHGHRSCSLFFRVVVAAIVRPAVAGCEVIVFRRFASAFGIWRSIVRNFSRPRRLLPYRIWCRPRHNDSFLPIGT
jgi:hypothetical protein